MSTVILAAVITALVGAIGAFLAVLAGFWRDAVPARNRSVAQAVLHCSRERISRR
jgi:hypothetical protein